MVSLEQNFQIHSKPSTDQNTIAGPRISFSSDFLSEENFILKTKKTDHQQDKTNNNNNNSEFEFLSTTNISNTQLQEQQMVTADELFFEGKLLPFWQIQHSDKLSKITLKTTKTEESDDDLHTTKKVEKKEREREKWFFDYGPSPRPPNCTLLWKELLKLKKQRAVSSLSTSSSSSSCSSSNSLNNVLEKNCSSGTVGNNQYMKRIKRGLERARSASIRIRPVINVPIVNASAQQGKNHNSNGTINRSDLLPPLFPLRKGR